MLLKRSICLIILLFSSPLFSQDRSKSVALIIGNSSYKNQPPLKNTIHDAIDINKTLLSLGFETIYKTNVTRKEMREAIRLFGKKLSKAKVALVYYSGHGIQVKGRNYLIPINTNIESEDEIQDEAVDAGSILRKMERAACSINIIILDACRNNPFARGFRSVNTGLAQMDAPKGSLLVYATAPGRTAGDGKGRNGIFTKSLLRYMKKPNLEIAQVFKKVTRDVSLETRNKQIPWTSSSLTEDFYFIKNKNKASSDIFIGKVTKVKIANLANKTTLAPGETAHFYAKVYNEKGNVVNKPVFWNVIGTRYGNVLSQNFRFQSPKQGDFVIEIKEPASNITKMVFMHVKGNPVFLPNQQLQNKQPLVGRVKNEKTKSDANTIYVYSEDQAQIISTFYYVKTKVYNIGAIKYRVREYLHKETNLPFILIPGGSFYMGDTSKERPFYRTDKDEKPIRLVHLKPFLMSKYEVTQSAWIMATGNNPWKKQKKRGFYKINGPDYPVVNFSWEKVKHLQNSSAFLYPVKHNGNMPVNQGQKRAITGEIKLTMTMPGI